MLSLKTINQPMAERLAPIRSKKDPNNVLVHEIYASVQGESTFMGIPCTFIRTTGCHLRCSYCDTEHAFYSGHEQSIDAILAKVKSLGHNLVELTGGEPLLQPASLTLLDELVKGGYTTLVETSGAVSIEKINKSVHVILDIKTPSSHESKKIVWRNLEILWPRCQIKFVIGTWEDYEFAKNVCRDFNFFGDNEVLFSPVVKSIDAAHLAEAIVNDKLLVRFQMQLHRVLFGEAQGK